MTTREHFAGFVVGTLLNDKLTDAERLEAIAQRALDEGIPHCDTIPERSGDRDPWLAELRCGICLNTYTDCDCGRTGRR